jgi:hypothetical protein
MSSSSLHDCVGCNSYNGEESGPECSLEGSVWK